VPYERHNPIATQSFSLAQMPMFQSLRPQRALSPSRAARVLRLILLVATTLFSLVVPASTRAQSPGQQCQSLDAQWGYAETVKPIPVLSGGVGFVTNFDGGQPHLDPLVSPVLLVPIGEHWLVETRETFESDLSQRPGTTGFQGQLQKEVDYAQLDYIDSPYLTVTLGRFLTPFGIFNERLYPIWVRNLQSDPLILPIGVGPSNASTGGMLRGGFKVTPRFNVNYAAYYSTLSTVSPVDSSRFAGGRVGIFVPKARLEVGGSFQHLLQDERSNLFGLHAVWQPQALPLDIRSEIARSRRGSGYWIEPAYRLSQLPFLRNQMRRTQLVARMQQYFVGSLPGGDDLPDVNTKLFEAGLNYYFIDGLRATGNYGRQFSVEGDKNVWTFGLTYRWVLSLGREETD
jgi:hypothetical protein